MSVVGFFYLSYALFERKPLKWFVRVVTPTLIGASILAIAGILEFIYIVRGEDPLMIIRIGVIYALVGGFIGICNGIFVEWPLVSDKPERFSPKGYLIGLILMFFICSLIASVYNLTPARSFLEGAILAPIGGIAGGLWQFINWAPSTSIDKAPKFSWKGCLVGLICAFLFGLVISLILGRSQVLSLLFASILAPTGGIVGGLWQFLKKDSLSAEQRVRISKNNDSILNDLSGKEHTEGDYLISNWRIVDDNLLAELSSIKKTSSISDKNTDVILNNLIEWEYTKAGIIVPKKKTADVSPSEESLAINKAPLFSLRGCLIGLISAFLFGFILALAVDITFGIDLIASLRAALTTASLIGPAGALTGGISRFIFWRANGLTDDQLGRIGAGLTLFGFLLQTFPTLVDLLNIPIH